MYCDEHFTCAGLCLCAAWCPGGVCVVRGVLSRSQFAHVVLSEVWLNASRFQQSLLAQRLRSAELFTFGCVGGGADAAGAVGEVAGAGVGAVLERVATKNALDELVCAAEESGDNGLIVLDVDVKEQILGAIKDGLGADHDAVQRQVPAVRWTGCKLC